MAKPAIYILEDSVELSNALIQPIKRQVEVKQFELAQALLDAIDSGSIPNLIASDCHMPGLSGIELCKALASRGLKLPVILMSGWADKKLLQDAMSVGAIDFLEKPFSIKRWVDSIQRALQFDIDQRIQAKRFRCQTELVQAQSELLRLLEGRLIDAENLAYGNGQAFPKSAQFAAEFVKAAKEIEKLHQQVSKLQSNLAEITDDEADIQTALILAPMLLNE